MSRPEPNQDERELRTLRLVKSVYDDLTRKVIARIKALPKEACRGGDDEVFADVWEDFKDQVQNQQSVIFEMYEDLVRAQCALVLAGLDQPTRGLLWVWSDDAFEWDEDDLEIPYGDPVDEALENELFRRVSGAADDEPLVESVAPEDEDEDVEDEPEAEEAEPEGEQESGAGAKSGRAPEATTSSAAPRGGCDCLADDAKVALSATQSRRFVADLANRSHFEASIGECEKCGQRFLAFFVELMEFDGGEDMQAWFHVPISAQESERLQAAGPGAVAAFFSEMNGPRRHLVDDYYRPADPRVSWRSGPVVLPPHF